MAKNRLFINISRVACVLILLLGTLSVAAPTKAANRADIVGPTGSSSMFPYSITVLANGNFVVTDPDFTPSGGPYGAGAVYLYDGITHTLINSLVGSENWAGLGYSGVMALSNGNYVVVNSSWTDGLNRGAVRYCSGITGCVGSTNPSNSLVGSHSGDLWNAVVVPFPNGNYAVEFPRWDNGSIVDAGAVLWCGSSSGCTGSISEANSLVGSQIDDQVGVVSVLANGNFIVTSALWDNGALVNAGAVTWCSGTSGCQGVVTPTNSVVGTNEYFYIMGTKLTNGNYVVSSTDWVNEELLEVGAARWCSGAGGCIGPMTAANSLVGHHLGDNTGLVTPLANGNYVVKSHGWYLGSLRSVGAATWCSGSGGCIGQVTETNSLVGSHQDDCIQTSRIYSLSDGDYIFILPNWDNGTIVDAGSVTWCSGTSGCIGTITPENSLVGSNANDTLGYDFGYRYGLLNNGSYVISSPNWDNEATVDAGALTWCSGVGGCTGAVTATNSLFSSGNIQLGDFINPLTNGNYMLGATIDGSDALILCSGAAGCVGSPADENYWIGSGSVVPLVNGDFVVADGNWNNGGITSAGAVMRCSGLNNCTEAISASNSLVGSQTNDHVGIAYALSDGGFVVVSQDWDNGATLNSGAVTWIGGAAGTTVGPITEENSVLGENASGGQSMYFVHDPTHFRLIISRPADNKITVLSLSTTSIFLPLVVK